MTDNDKLEIAARIAFGDAINVVVDRVQAGEELPVVVASVIVDLMDIQSLFPKKGFERMKKDINEAFLRGLELSASLAAIAVNKTGPIL